MRKTLATLLLAGTLTAEAQAQEIATQTAAPVLTTSTARLLGLNEPTETAIPKPVTLSNNAMTLLGIDTVTEISPYSVTPVAGVDYCIVQDPEVTAYLNAKPQGTRSLPSILDSHHPYLQFKGDERKVAEYIARDELTLRIFKKKGSTLSNEEAHAIERAIPAALRHDEEIKKRVSEKIGHGKTLASDIAIIDAEKANCREAIHIRKPRLYTPEVKAVLDEYFGNSCFGYEPLIGKETRNMTHIKTWLRFSGASGPLRTRQIDETYLGINNALESLGKK